MLAAANTMSIRALETVAASIWTARCNSPGVDRAGSRFSKCCSPRPSSPSRSRVSRSSSRSRRARTAARRRRPMPPFLRSRRWSSCETLPTPSTRSGVPRTDLDTDITVVPERPHGGTGLQPSPAGALGANTVGYVDYLDASGTSLGGLDADTATWRGVHPPLVGGTASDQPGQHDRPAGPRHADPSRRCWPIAPSASPACRTKRGSSR